MEKYFKGFDIEFVKRNQNSEADELAKIASNGHPLPPDVFYTVQTEPSIANTSEVKIVSLIEGEDWRAPIIAYLKGFFEPENPIEAKRMQHRSRNYRLIGDDLFKAGVVQTLLKCLSFEEGKNLIKEVHEGTCGAHAGPRAIVSKVSRQGFYWPTAFRDAQEVIQRCEACQRFAN